jgi:hypothetical protein
MFVGTYLARRKAIIFNPDGESLSFSPKKWRVVTIKE